MITILHKLIFKGKIKYKNSNFLKKYYEKEKITLNKKNNIEK